MNNRRNDLLVASAKKYCKSVVSGKTLKYNQIITNGNMASSSGWAYYGNASVSVSNGILHYTSQSAYDGLFNGIASVLFENHKYLLAFTIKNNSNKQITLKLFCNSYSFGEEMIIENVSSYKIYSYIAIPSSNNTNRAELYISNYDANVNYDIYNVMLIDLTAIFGEYNEPSSVAEFYQTDLGKLVAKGKYLPTTTENKFIQAQSPLRFVGRNIWNEQWELGRYSWSDGTKTKSNENVRCKELIKFYPNAIYFVKCPQGKRLELFFYDANKDFIGYPESSISNRAFTTPNNCYYVAFYMQNSYGTTYKHDICISENLFDYKTLNKDFCIDNNGDLSSETNSYASDLIKVNGGTTIVCNMYLSQVCAYDKNKNFLFFLNNGNDFEANQNIILPPNCEYIRISRRYGLIFTEGTTLFYVGYEPYCGVDTKENSVYYNQNIKNGNFANTNNWTLSASYLRLVCNDNVGKVEFNGFDYDDRIEQSVSMTSYFKYAIIFKAKVNIASTQCKLMIGSQTIADNFSVYGAGWDFQTLGYVFTYIGSSGNATLSLYLNRLRQLGYGVAWSDYFAIKNFMLVNLTQLFGGGNEPSTIEDFYATEIGQAIYNGYYLPYSQSNSNYYVGSFSMQQGNTWQTWNGKLTQTMALVDLEDLTFNDDNPLYTCTLSDAKAPASNGNWANAKSEKYELISSYNLYDAGLEHFAISIEKTLKILSDYAPSGMLMYELATYTTKQEKTLMINRNTIKCYDANDIELDFTKE